MGEFGVPEAQIVGLFMEAVFYGIYLVTFFSCMRVLLWRDGQFKSWEAVNKMMVLSALLMLVFGTLDVSFGLLQNLEAFIYQAAKGITPEEEFGKISKWSNVMKFANYAAQTFIGDGILIYRCYVIYNRRWYVVIAPVCMWLATAVTSSFTIYIEATIGTGNLSESSFQPFISSTLALTLAMNVITTSLIVWRIFKIQSRASNHATAMTQGSPYSRLIRTLIECGAMYTLSIIVLFGCYLANHNAILGVSNSVVQIIGIAFNLLILNIDRGTTYHASSSAHANGSHYIESGRNVPLHQLRIQKVTTTIHDGPEGYGVRSHVKSSPGDPDEDMSSRWDDRSETDVEKGRAIRSHDDSRGRGYPI